jgi:hypothetical protein
MSPPSVVEAEGPLGPPHCPAYFNNIIFLVIVFPAARSR